MIKDSEWKDKFSNFLLFTSKNIAMQSNETGKEWFMMERVSLEQHVAEHSYEKKCARFMGIQSSGIWTDVDNNRPCILVSRIVDDRERGLCCVVLLCCMHSYLTDRESAIFAFEITKRSACFPAISIDFAPWRKQQTSLPFTNARSILSWPSFIQNSPSNDIPSIF